jgi:hypothetical protein
MKRLLERTFVVEAAAERAWAELLAAERWPRWAQHLRSVQVTPPGPVGPASSATLKLTNHTRATVRVTEFEDERRFRGRAHFCGWVWATTTWSPPTTRVGRASPSPSTPPVPASTRSGPSLPASTPASWTVRSPDCRPCCDHPIRHGPHRALVLEEPRGGSTNSIERPLAARRPQRSAAGIGIAAGAGPDRGIQCGERGPVNITTPARATASLQATAAAQAEALWSSIRLGKR